MDVYLYGIDLNLALSQLATSLRWTANRLASVGPLGEQLRDRLLEEDVDDVAEPIITELAGPDRILAAAAAERTIQLCWGLTDPTISVDLPPPEWWPTSLGRLVIRAVGDHDSDEMSITGVFAALDVGRARVYQLLAEDRIDRGQGGGVRRGSVARYLRERERTAAMTSTKLVVEAIMWAQHNTEPEHVERAARAVISSWERLTSTQRMIFPNELGALRERLVGLDSPDARRAIEALDEMRVETARFIDDQIKDLPALERIRLANQSIERINAWPAPDPELIDEWRRARARAVLNCLAKLQLDELARILDVGLPTLLAWKGVPAT